jgi:hypothetical protein
MMDISEKRFDEQEVEMRELRARIAELERERDAWKESANEFCNNQMYYIELIDKAARSIGLPMFTADDSGVHPEPLRAKLPECVEQLVIRTADLAGEVAWYQQCLTAQKISFDASQAREAKLREVLKIYAAREEQEGFFNSVAHEALALPNGSSEVKP